MSTMAPIEFVAPDSNRILFVVVSTILKSRKARRKLTPLGKRCPVRFVTVTSAVSVEPCIAGLLTEIVAVCSAACSRKLRMANGIPLFGSCPLQPLDM